MNKKYKIKLGDLVNDLISGHKGIVVARTEFINGCIQYSIAGKLKAGEKLSPEGEPSIDAHSLKVIKTNVIPSKEYEDDEDDEDDVTTGGRNTYGKSMRGY